MEWLDAMRGFTMILVVAYHVALMSFGEVQKTSASMSFLVLFRMPLFFFVSGFLAYRASFDWTVGNALSLTWKKVKIQVVPTIVFLCAFLVIHRNGSFGDGLLYSLKSPFKGGYWFTWVLLHMFIIYYAVCLVARNRHWAIWALWVVSLLVYESMYMPKVFTYHKDPWFNYTSVIQTMQYMQFFVFGNLAHRYWDRFQRLMDTKGFFTCVVLLAFVCCADIFKWHVCKTVWTNLPRTLSMYTLLTIVLMTFRYYRDTFVREHFVGRALQYIGTRTLDVYVLHYFFLPSIPFLGVWLNANQPNFVVDVVLSASVGLIVIGFCLLISNLLRVSPIYREYLFGRK